MSDFERFTAFDSVPVSYGTTTAPDEVAELREKVRRQASELTSLRIAIEQRNGDLRCRDAREGRVVRKYGEALEQNRLLREFVGDMYEFLMLVHGPDPQFERRMRELGVEVPE